MEEIILHIIYDISVVVAAHYIIDIVLQAYNRFVKKA